MSGGTANLKPWPKGMSGNPGGRPKKKPITEELERLLADEVPNGNGQTWATVIAEALLHEARKGDVRAISELANRIEGKPVQAIDLNSEGWESIGERLERARRRRLEAMTREILEGEAPRGIKPVL